MGNDTGKVEYKEEVIKLFNSLSYEARLIAISENCISDINRIEIEKERLKKYFKRQIAEMTETQNNIILFYKSNIKELKEKGYL